MKVVHEKCDEPPMTITGRAVNARLYNKMKVY